MVVVDTNVSVEEETRDTQHLTPGTPPQNVSVEEETRDTQHLTPGTPPQNVSVEEETRDTQHLTPGSPPHFDGNSWGGKFLLMTMTAIHSKMYLQTHS